MWNIIVTLAFSVLSGVLGYYLGLKSRRPLILVERFVCEQNKTCFVLKNAGESTALNIKIADMPLKLSETFFGMYTQFEKDTAVFKFESVDHLVPEETKESNCFLTFGDGKNSDAGLALFSKNLKGKMLQINYRDGFGLRYSTKFVLDKNKIITK